MRNGKTSGHLRRLGPATAVVLLAGLSAACSDSVRLGQPLFTGSTDNQRSIIDGQNQPMPPALTAGAQPVSRAPLPPPTTVASAGYQPAPTSGPYAWTAVGGSVLTVGPGEALSDLAVKYGVPEEQILAANQLSRPSQVTPGRVIVIPRRVAISPDSVGRSQPNTYASAPQAAPINTAPAYPAQVAPAPAAPAKLAAATPPAIATGGTYVVQAGDTLYSIARRHGARVDDLAARNNLASPSHIRVGQRLIIDGAPRSSATTSTYAATKPVPANLQPTKVSTAPVTMTKPAAPPQAQVASAPKLPQAPALPAPSASTPKTQVASIDTAADPASKDGNTFRWPVRGRIISGFGNKAGGTRNDGINLAVPEGTSVKATEAGTVIYSGNELEGYGNLVLVRHANGWVSAYAHNKELKVKRGDTIRRGQTVALAGRTGSVSTPQVHFELRRGAKPVNPLDHLTGA